MHDRMPGSLPAREWFKKWQRPFALVVIAFGPLVSEILILALVWLYDHTALGRLMIWPAIFIIPVLVETLGCLMLPIEVSLRLILAVACSTIAVPIGLYIYIVVSCLLQGECI